LNEIIDLDKEDFIDLFNTLEVRSLIKKFKPEKPLDKIRLVEKIYQNYQSVDFGKLDKNLSQSKITLITCRQEEYYCCLFDINDKPGINQILYCQSETKPEEIEVFLYRARLLPTKKHFIMSVHNLNIELQLHFCDLLNSYFISR